MGKKVRLALRRSGVTVILFLGVAVTFPTISSANTLELVGSEHVEKTDSGEVVRRWTEGEWKAWRNELDGLSQAVDEPVVGDISSLPSVETLPAHAQESVETIVSTARESGAGLESSESTVLDGLGEDAGGIAEVGGASLLGTVALGGAAFYLGVEIGNGIDQLFGFPSFAGRAQQEEEAEEQAPGYGCNVSFKGEGEEIEANGEGGERWDGPPGYYVSCESHGAMAVRSTGYWTSGSHGSEPGWSTYAFTAPVHVQHTHSVVRVSRTGCYGECHEESVYTYGWNESSCKIEVVTAEMLKGVQPDPYECQPKGVPFTGPLSKSIEESNAAHGFSSVPSVTPLDVPPVTPTELSPERVETTTLNDPAREHIERTETPKKIEEEEAAKEEEEKRKKLIPVPFPWEGETGEEYAKELEEHELAPNVKTLPAEYIDPRKGPSAVVTVVPTPGTSVEAGSTVEVNTNPATAPAPLPGGGIGAPSLPGIHLPHMTGLCKNFPFGVPCWLWQEVESWSSTKSPPTLGWASFEIDHHVVPAVAVSLSPLEGVMEVVRVFELVLGSIGVVLLFYRFAKGGSPDSGSNTAGGGDGD